MTSFPLILYCWCVLFYFHSQAIDWWVRAPMWDNFQPSLVYLGLWCPWGQHYGSARSGPQFYGLWFEYTIHILMAVDQAFLWNIQPFFNFELLLLRISFTKNLMHFFWVFICRCAYDQQGQLLISPAKVDGVLGLSNAKVSLPSQLASQGVISNGVGHCISSSVNGGGYMFLGDAYIPRWGMTSVPMLNSPMWVVFSWSCHTFQSKIIQLQC